MAQLKITVVGDIMCEPLMQHFAKRRSGYEFDFVYARVKSLFSDSDLVIGNLETPLAGANAKYCNSLFSFNAPDEFAASLVNAGFDFVTTANNHCLDRGIDGMKRTLNVLDEFGLAHTGTWTSPSERQAASYIRRAGQTIAIVSGTYGTNYTMNNCKLEGQNEQLVSLFKENGELPSGSKAESSQSLPIRLLKKPFKLLREEDKIAIKKKLGMYADAIHEDNFLDEAAIEPYMQKLENCIREASQNSDFVLFYPHIGGQFNINPGRFTNYVVQRAVDAGADCVIASHPHVVQKAERVASVPCFYSIGNFSMSPMSDYLPLENLPQYGLAVHLYINSGLISKMTYSILKMVEDEDSPLTVWPINDLYKLRDEKYREQLVAEALVIKKRICGNAIYEPVIAKEYPIFSEEI